MQFDLAAGGSGRQVAGSSLIMPQAAGVKHVVMDVDQQPRAGQSRDDCRQGLDDRQRGHARAHALGVHPHHEPGTRPTARRDPVQLDDMRVRQHHRPASPARLHLCRRPGGERDQAVGLGDQDVQMSVMSATVRVVRVAQS